ncbi:hypothetical protein BJV82DRAFT_688117 [Fennellomyces sp. T-0311]|nr:hypothetical protein BJV82DRAFT_688117 [Fennellomyces sp. T-0311]
MPKVEWTPEDRRTVLNAKLNNPYWSWDMIASTIDYRQTRDACRLLYENRYPAIKTKKKYDIKRIRESSPAWSFPQRRRMAKLRGMKPPTSWKTIAQEISKDEYDYHPPTSCQRYYNEIMSVKEKKRGRAEAASEAARQNREQMTRAEGLTSWVTQRWSPDEEELLFELCTNRTISWAEIAERLKRTVASVQGKWRRMDLKGVSSTRKAKGKVVKDKNKKAAGIGKKSSKKKAIASRSGVP